MLLDLFKTIGLLICMLIIPINGFGQSLVLKELPITELLERIDAAPEDGAARLELSLIHI